MPKFDENPCSGSNIAQCGQTDGRTNRHDEGNIRFSKFCESAKKLRNDVGSSVYHLLLFFHVRPVIRPEIASAVRSHKNVGGPTILLNDGHYTPTKSVTSQKNHIFSCTTVRSSNLSNHNKCISL